MSTTRALSFLSVVLLLVILQASSAPVYNIKKTHQRSPEVSNYSQFPGYVETVDKIKAEYSQASDKVAQVFGNFTCSACRYAVRLLQDMFDSRMSFDAIADAAGEICYLAKIQDKTVCKGIAHTFKVLLRGGNV